MCCYDLKQVAGGEEHYVKKPTRFLTNSPCIGNALSLKCCGQHRHIELTGGGRTRRSEIYPDNLCRAILNGLVKQMEVDDRLGCSFKPCNDDLSVDHLANVENFDIGEVSWDLKDESDVQTLTWSRKDYGTSRLMMPGCNGPLWSSCTRRVTRDLDTNQVIEDRPAWEVTGKERRREFKGKAKKQSQRLRTTWLTTLNHTSGCAICVTTAAGLRLRGLVTHVVRLTLSKP